MRALYSLNIFLYGTAIRIAALFNAKARLWVSGRRNLFSELEKQFKSNTNSVAWFHCASLGEFEQGRPLIEEFKRKYPNYKILVTFFSPSGYEIRKNYEGADFVFYLPLDTKSQAQKFVDIVNPSVVYFVKYEFWLNFLAEFRKRNISHFLISSIFRKNQIFFKSYGSIFRQALSGFTYIFTQEQESIALLKNIGIVNAEVAGDTRFDRVIEITTNRKEINIAKSFAGLERKVIVAGSTWPTDEDKLLPAIKGAIKIGWKLMIAPHELGEDHLLSIEKGLNNIGVGSSEIIRYSHCNEINSARATVLIIDNIGMLSSLYHYGSIAYVGGGFGKSIHNVLEPAVYGMPILFGPNFEKFYEAKQLIEIGAAIGINNAEELRDKLDKIAKDAKLIELMSIKSREFVQHSRGATKLILEKSVLFLNH